MVEKCCDGDEANIFVPQSYKTKANVIANMMPQNCIMSEQTHKMMVGVVQDALMGAYFLTTPGVYVDEQKLKDIATYTFKYFERSFPSKYRPTNLQSWVQNVLDRSEKEGNIRYSGRSLFSVVFPEDFVFSMMDKDVKVEIRNGILVSGQMNAAVLHKSHNSVIQVYTKRYGSYLAAELISNITRMCQSYLSQRGYSVGIADCMVSTEQRNLLKKKKQEALAKADQLSKTVVPDPILEAIKEQRILSTLNENHKLEQANIVFKPGKTYKVGPKEVVQLVYVHETKTFTNEDKVSQLEVHRKKNYIVLFNNKSNTFTMEKLVAVKIGENLISLNTTESAFASSLGAGAKGEQLQLGQIYDALGQATFSGQRIPLTMTNNTRILPHFPQNSQDPQATGFTLNSYISGMNPVELYLNFIQAREPQTDTTIKTARTGYVQRKLVKYLQDLKVENDESVRTDKQRIVQFQYGNWGASVDKLIEVDGESQFTNVRQRVREVLQQRVVENAYVFYLEQQEWEEAATCAYQFYKERLILNRDWIQNLTDSQRKDLDYFKNEVFPKLNRYELTQQDLKNLYEFDNDVDFVNNNKANTYLFYRLCQTLKMKECKELYFELKMMNRLNDAFRIISYLKKDLVIFVPMNTQQELVEKLNLMFDHVIVGGERDEVYELPYKRMVVFDNTQIVKLGSDSFIIGLDSGVVDADQNGPISPFEVIINNKPSTKKIKIKKSPYKNKEYDAKSVQKWKDMNKQMFYLLFNKIY